MKSEKIPSVPNSFNTCASLVALPGPGSWGRVFTGYLSGAERGWETGEQVKHFISKDTQSHEENT